MKHKHIQKHLSAYLDNELAPDVNKVIDDHLRDCQECVDMLEAFRDNRAQIAGLVHPAPSMKDAVLAMIRENASESRRRFLPTVKRWVFRPITVGATAFSTVCLLIAFFMFTYSPAPEYDELLDFYFGVHTEEVANNPLKSNVATPLSDATADTESIVEDTDSILELYFDE